MRLHLHLLKYPTLLPLPMCVLRLCSWLAGGGVGCGRRYVAGEDAGRLWRYLEVAAPGAGT